jgi:hypothetical protein
MSGATQSAVLQAIRFLGITDAEEHVTDDGRALVNAYGTEAWQPQLKKVLESAYEPIFGADFTPRDTTPSDFRAKLRAAGVADGQMIDKTGRFYIKAAQDAGIQLNKYLIDMKGSPRASSRRNDQEKGTQEPPKPRGEPKPADAALPDGYARHPIPFPNRPAGWMVIPIDLDERDVRVIEATFAYLRTLAAIAEEGS